MHGENVMNVMDKRAERLHGGLFKAVPNKKLLMRKGINIKAALPPHTELRRSHKVTVKHRTMRSPGDGIASLWWQSAVTALLRDLVFVLFVSL